MASKRILKKRVKDMVIDVLDSCDYIIVNEGSNADKADQLIDEAVDFHDTIIARIGKASSKKDFNEIVSDVKKGGEDFVKKLNALNK